MKVPIEGLNVDQAVKDRYSAGAQAREEALCCPVSYNAKYLSVLPAEILERDYGCGDPSEHVRTGETVLDLGSGAGKICYIAAQVVGAGGRVIGVDINDEMLALARKHQPAITARIGFDNVTFIKGRIQDLALNFEEMERALETRPIRNSGEFVEFEAGMADQRTQRPLIPSGSIDVVVSNCVLNLVSPDAKSLLFHEIYRVLKPGGRAVISDIVAERDVPLAMQNNPELWSGCISGAYREDLFLQAFGSAGFHGMEILKRGSSPWKVVEGIAFWSVTVAAYKSGQAAASEKGSVSLIYKGPFSHVTDDTGKTWSRGEAQSLPLPEATDYLREPFLNHFESAHGSESVPVLKDFSSFKPLPKPKANCC